MTIIDWHGKIKGFFEPKAQTLKNKTFSHSFWVLSQLTIVGFSIAYIL